MKKKLVAFAVTAAMVITSAVPALAWGPAVSDEWPSTNAVLIDANHLKGGISEAGTTIKDGDTYSITVDFNRTSGSFQYVLNMVDGNGKDVSKKLCIDGAVPEVYMDGDVAGKVGVEGITTLTWKFDTSKEKKFIELVVDVQGRLGAETNGAEKIYRMDLGGAQKVKTVEFEAFGGGDVTGSTVIYQNQIPDEVTDVEVVLADKTGTPVLDKYGEFQVVNQPVMGDWYAVRSITLNDGTEIEYFDIDESGDVVETTALDGAALLKYVDLSWEVTKRDGTAMNMYTVDDAGNESVLNQKSYDGRSFYVAKAYEGSYVTLTVTGDKTSGIFGEVVWGEGADSLAIQQRIAGEDRYETAMKVADQMENAGAFDTIFVATGTNYADALSVTPLAKQQKAPILLVNAAHEDEVIQYIKDNVASYDAKIFIVGGTSVVSADFEKALKKVIVDVDRLAGDDRYATNIEILKMFHEEGSLGSMLVASGANYPDALSAAATGKPVVLVGNELTREQRTYLHDVGTLAKKAGNKISYTIIGGRDAVSNDLRDELASDNLYNATVDRIGGVNRYETNMMVMNQYVDYTKANYAFVASGMDYPDALTGGVLAARNDSPLVLANPNVIDPARDIIEKTSASGFYDGLVVIGGENAVSNATVQKIA